MAKYFICSPIGNSIYPDIINKLQSYYNLTFQNNHQPSIHRAFEKVSDILQFSYIIVETKDHYGNIIYIQSKILNEEGKYKFVAWEVDMERLLKTINALYKENLPYAIQKFKAVLNEFIEDLKKCLLQKPSLHQNLPIPPPSNRPTNYYFY